MKSKKKVLVTVLCAVLLVVGSVLGTMANLTKTTDTATNTFTVGNVTITLDEAKVDVNGVAIPNADRVTGNEYKLIPGHTYLKDPTIHVDANSEDCWLFVKVENGISGIEATGGNETPIASQMVANGWTSVTGETNVYAYRSKVNAGDNIAVFGGFKIASNADTSTYVNQDGKVTATIKVTGYAVQADGFTTAADAWAAAPARW